MALTGPVHLPTPRQDTPVPFRVSTEAVRVFTPPPISTAQHAAIRARIEPNERWWQFPLPTMPWEAVLAFRVWAVTVGVGFAAITVWRFIEVHR